MKKLILMETVAVVFSAATALAGWTSGGGELIGDTHNPWFIQNTNRVNYCVLVDETNFGQSKKKIEKRIQIAFNFWKEQLRDLASTTIISGEEVLLGTQDFSQINDCASADIVFQFGVLSGEQMRAIGDPTHFVGLSVRTDYDRVNLRGKGFVYFSPQSGPLQVKSEKQNKIWSIGGGSVLTPALIHEIGHIFGLQHSNSVNLMDDKILESFLNSDFLGQIANTWSEMEIGRIPISLFKFNPDPNAPHFGMCMVSEPSHPVPNPKPLKGTRGGDTYTKFFGIPENAECRSENISLTKYSRLAGPRNGPQEVYGEAELEMLPQKFSERVVVVELVLPKEQKVISDSGMRTIDFSMYATTIFKGKYVIKKTGETRDIFIEASPSWVKQIGGVMDGELYPDVNRLLFTARSH